MIWSFLALILEHTYLGWSCPRSVPQNSCVSQYRRAFMLAMLNSILSQVINYHYKKVPYYAYVLLGKSVHWNTVS